MAISSTNLTFSSLQTEFGGSGPISLSEYYRGGSYFKTNYFHHSNFGQPSSSGQIAVGNFRQSANPHLNHNTELNTIYEIDALSNYLWGNAMIFQNPQTQNGIRGGYYQWEYPDSSVIPDFDKYVHQIIPTFRDHVKAYPSRTLDYVTIKTFVVPIGCTYVDIEAWGGGGGGAGKIAQPWYTGGYGGSGGYCTTRLVVGTHINEGDIIFCSPGLAGASAPHRQAGGQGGSASVVWKNTRYISQNASTPFRTYNIIGVLQSTDTTNLALDQYFSGNITDSNRKLFLHDNFTMSQAILCAGGGGGGSCGFRGNGANGGGAGNDGGDGKSSGSSGANTRATSNNNFTGYITNDNVSAPKRGGNVWPYHGAYPDDFKIFGYTNEPGIVDGSLTKAWFASPMCDYVDNWFSNNWWTWGPTGGGGFYTSGAGQVIYDTNDVDNSISRGGGGGTNAVYLGINTSVSNGGSPTAPVTTGILTSIDSNFCSGGERDVATSPLQSDGFVGAHGQKGKIAIKFIG